MRLLESNAPRRRTRGGTLASIVVHVLVIGSAVVATATAGVPNDDEPREVVIPYVSPTPPEPAPPTDAPRVKRPSGPALPSAPAMPTVSEIPDVIPPPAAEDPLRGINESFERGLRPSAGDRGASSGGVPIGDGPLDERYVDRAAVPLGTVRPRYPEPLRAAGVSGTAVVRFVVDTLGRVEPGSAELVSATHPAFGDAALRTVPSLRFRPAEAGGHRVRQLVQLPFEFRIE